MITKKRLFRKQVAVFIAIVIALSLVTPVYAGAAFVGKTEISSKGAVVVDFDTGIMLYGHNENTRVVPASTIKILAVLVIYDAVKAGEISLDSTTRIRQKTSEFSLDRTYSNVPLPEGTSVTINELIEVVMIRSACAATVAMGEALCGSEAAFLRRMRDRATQLGVTVRVYDCWGGSPDNRITPLGMATLSRTLIMEHPEVLSITSKRSVTFKGVTYNSSNLLLGEYTGLDGLKTGFTEPAGYCFIGTARRAGRRIIAVTMGSTLQSRYPDTRALLDYGFANAEKAIEKYYNKNPQNARPSSANLILNGETMPLSAYIIKDSHYFKLRDIAFLLRETELQFEVVWSAANNAISLTSGVPYTATGSEMKLPFDGSRPYKPTPSKIYYDGVVYSLEAYFIDELNYFRLRDLGELMGFGVDWEGETRTVIINTLLEPE